MMSRPPSANRRRMSGSPSTAWISRFSRSTISLGVAAGTITPCQVTRSKSGIVSASTASSPKGPMPRFGFVEAIARTRPDFTCPCATLTTSKSRLTSPPISAFNAGALPLYCTMIISAPAWMRSSSQPTCGSAPEEAQLTLPGFARARAMTSATVFAGNAGWGQQHHRRAVQVDDRGELPERIDARLQKKRVGDDRRDNEHDRVAVRRGPSRRFVADVASGPAAILDDCGLSHALGEFRGQEARHDVGGSSGRERHDPADRLRRPRGLRLRERPRERRRGDENGRQMSCVHAPSTRGRRRRRWRRNVAGSGLGGRSKATRHRNLVALCIHALDVGVVVAPLEPVRGGFSSACPGRRADEEPAAGAGCCAASAAERGTRGGAYDGAHRRALRCAVRGYVRRRFPPDLEVGELAALDVVVAELVEALS